MWHRRGSDNLPVQIDWRRVKAGGRMIAKIANRTAIGFVAVYRTFDLLTTLVYGGPKLDDLLICRAIATAINRRQSRLQWQD